MIKRIMLGGKEIAYELHRKKVKNINLRVRADGSMSVSANHAVSMAVVEEFLLSKEKLILRALARIDARNAQQPKPLCYTDGELIRVLGRDYVLRVRKGTQNGVALDGETLTLTVKDAEDSEQKRCLIERWLESLCRETVTMLCEAVYPKFVAYGVAYPTLRFRHMTSRWGSCHVQKGIVTFNYKLVEYPMDCIEYVVIHEMTHFLQADHSKRFYQLLSSFLPDWQTRRTALRGD